MNKTLVKFNIKIKRWIKILINYKERLNDFWCYPKLSKFRNLRDYDDGYFNFLNQQPDREGVSTSLYVHIPFCNSGCIFCPYYKLFGKRNYQHNIDRYVDAVIHEIKHYASTPYLHRKKIVSVHFGGGNPFLLSISQIKKIVDSIHMAFDVQIEDNWSIEGCISSIETDEYAKGLLDLGINRLSFGVQTFHPQIRKEMNIRATLNNIYQGVELLTRSGFDGYCADMMYNMPDQSTDVFLDDLKKITELNPYHIDLYNMEISPNTYLSNLIEKENRFKIKPSDENQRVLYKIGSEWLKDHGYKRLATNIYSQRQEELQQGDKLYLKNGNMLGIGVSSRGYLDGYSYKNVCEIDEYCKQVESGKFPANLAYQSTPEQMLDRMMIFFPVLMKISKKEIPDWTRYQEKIEYLISSDLAYWDDDELKLTEKGIFWSGNIGALFIGAENMKPYFQTVLSAVRSKVNYYNEDDMGHKKMSWEEIDQK